MNINVYGNGIIFEKRINKVSSVLKIYKYRTFAKLLDRDK